MKAILDLIPLLAFFVTALKFGIIEAAGALLIATIIVHVIHLVLQKGKLDKQQWIVLILTVVFCGFTILLKDDFYIKLKSPIINGIFAIALFVSILINKPLMQFAMKQMFTLDLSGWKKLTLAWGLFFSLMAGLHYVTAFHMSDEVWINFKTWGWIPIMLVFMTGQFMLLKNHLNPELANSTASKK